MNKLNFSTWPVALKMAAVAVALPAFVLVMSLMGGCGGVASLNNPAEPTFYIGHQGDQNPVWLRTSGSDVVSPLLLPAALNGASVGDIAVLKFPTNGNWLYVVSQSLGALVIVDISSSTYKTIATIPIGLNPAGLAIDSNATFAYVSVLGGNAINIVDLSTYQSVATVPLPANSLPRGIVITADDKKVYVANSGLGTVSVLDTATRTITGTITVGQVPLGLSIGPNGEDLYAANTVSGTVSVVDTLTNTVSSTISGLGVGQASAVSPSGTTLFVVKTAANGLGPASVIPYDTASLTTSGGPYATSSRPFAMLGLGADSFLSADFDSNVVTERWVVTGNAPISKTLNVGNRPISLAMARQVSKDPVKASQYVVSANPAFLQVRADGIPYVGTQTFTNWVPNSSHQLSATTPQTDISSGTDRWVFQNWTGSATGSTNPLTVTADPLGASYTANFQRYCKLTVTVVGTGTVTAAPTSPDGYYLCGSAVVLTANPGTGNQFTSWTGDATGSTSPLVVPLSTAKNVIATFSPSSGSAITIDTTPVPLAVQFNSSPTQIAPASASFPAGTVTLTAATPQILAGTQYKLFSWSPGGQTTPSITVSSPTTATTYTANFQVECHILTLAVSPPGAATLVASPAAFNNCYVPGTAVTVTASGLSGNVVTSWTGATGTGNSATLAMTAPTTVTANIGAPSTATHTIATTPPNLNIQVDGGPQQITPFPVTWTSGSAHVLAAPTPQLVAGTRYGFLNWSPGGQTTSSISIAAPPTATNFIANYQVECYVLTLAVTPAGGGTLVASPAVAGNCYAPGTVVTITATGANGNVVQSWTGTTGSGNTATVTVGAPTTVTVNFGAPAAVNHSITTSPAGLQVTVDSVTKTAPATASWAPATIHTLAVPSPQNNTAGDTRYTFTSWSPTVGASVTAPATPTTYTASFSTAYRVSIVFAGNCGVTANIGTTFPVFVNAGTAITASFLANSGSFFQGVTVNGVPASSNLVSIASLNAPVTMTATCVADPLPNLNFGGANWGYTTGTNFQIVGGIGNNGATYNDVKITQVVWTSAAAGGTTPTITNTTVLPIVLGNRASGTVSPSLTLTSNMPVAVTGFQVCVSGTAVSAISGITVNWTDTQNCSHVFPK